MLARVTSFFRGPCRSLSGHGSTPFAELERELEDLRKFSLSSVMMFLGIHLIAGSETLGPLTNALLIYTISLHLVVSANFLQNCPALSRFLHSIPLLGICSMAVFELIMAVQSPAIAAGGLLVGTLPVFIIVIYHARSRAENDLICLPVRLCEVSQRTYT